MPKLRQLPTAQSVIDDINRLPADEILLLIQKFVAAGRVADGEISIADRGLGPVAALYRPAGDDRLAELATAVLSAACGDEHTIPGQIFRRVQLAARTFEKGDRKNQNRCRRMSPESVRMAEEIRALKAAGKTWRQIGSKFGVRDYQPLRQLAYRYEKVRQRAANTSSGALHL
jgi:hypothetical protein